MVKKKTTEDFKKEVYGLVKDEYKVLGEYINSKTKIKMKHNKCGHIYSVKPEYFLRGNRCPDCYGTKKRTTEEFKQEVYNLVKDEYEVLGEYINKKTYIKMKHSKCNHIYNVRPDDFLRGSRCPNCAKNKKKTTQEFKKEVYNLVKDEYEVLGEYVNTETYIDMVHNTCGTVYKVTPHGFLGGNRCAVCYGNKRKTTEDFKKEVYDLVKDEYEVLGEYTGNKKYIEIKHNKCGFIYEIFPQNFLRGNKCPKCTCPNRDRDTEKFKKEVYDLVKDEYTVLGEYITSETHIEMRHNKCGRIYNVFPKNFLRGNRCSKCLGLIKKTTEEFKKEVHCLVGNEYEVLSEYVNSKEHIKIKHSSCGNIYYTSPSGFLRGSRCPECAIKLNAEKRTKTTEEFKQEVYKLVHNEYQVLGDYINANTPITIKHNTCRCVFSAVPNNFLRGSRCPDCYGTKKKTTEEFKQEVYKLVDNEYQVLGDYINTKTPIKMKHNKCGHIYLVSPGCFLRGNRCPKCLSRKGESAIMKILDKYNINYQHNKSYGGCSYKGLLRFDFLVFDKKGNLLLIIEFDGEQHFKPVKVFGGEERFKENQIRDNIKNEFCKKNNIPLLRIPYWEIDNIHKILGKKLYKLRLL